MGWETTLTTHLRFNRKTYNHYYEVENDLDEVREIINRQWKDMRSLAYMTEPKKFCEEEETPVMFIEQSLRDIQEILEEYIVEEYKLRCLLEDWDKCHDKETGRAIPDPEGVSWDSAFLDGDFVETTKDNLEKDHKK